MEGGVLATSPVCLVGIVVVSLARILWFDFLFLVPNNHQFIGNTEITVQRICFSVSYEPHACKIMILISISEPSQISIGEI